MTTRFGDVNRLLSWTNDWRFDTGDVVIERLLVKNIAKLPGSALEAALKAAPLFLAVDFEQFDVVGVTLLPLDVGESVGDYRVQEQGEYILDVVFRMSNWEYEYVDTSKQAVQAQSALQQTGFAGASLPLVKVLQTANVSTFTGEDEANANEFWKKQPALMVKLGDQQATPGKALDIGHQLSPKTWGKQLAFGLADYPELLEPYVAGALVTPDGGGGKGSGVEPLFKWLGGSGGGPKMSTDNLLVWGLFAVGGAVLAHQAYKAWGK